MGRCFVPNCKSGYDKQTEKVSVFRVPADKLSQWQRKIRRQDRILSTKDYVCEKHFQPQYIIREVTTEVYSYSVAYPRLTKDAMPTIFPNCPKYLSKEVKQRRSLHRHVLVDKKRKNIEPKTSTQNSKNVLKRNAVPSVNLPSTLGSGPSVSPETEKTELLKILQHNPLKRISDEDQSCNFEEVYIKEEALEEIPDEVNENVHKENNACLRIKEENIETIPIKQEYVEEEELNKDTNSCNVSGDYEMCNTKSATKFDDIVVKEEPIESESADTELYTTLVENIKKESL